MENLTEIFVRGFDFSDLSAYLKLASGQVTLDTLFASFMEGLTTFFNAIFGTAA